MDRQTRELKMGNVYLKNFFGKVGIIQADTFGADEVQYANSRDIFLSLNAMKLNWFRLMLFASNLDLILLLVIATTTFLDQIEIKKSIS